MPRQYRILYKRDAGPFTAMKPFVNTRLYDRPEVAVAIEYMRQNPHVEGMAMKLDTERFNIMSFEQDAEAPNSFTFEPLPAAAKDVVLDASQPADSTE